MHLFRRFFSVPLRRDSTFYHHHHSVRALYESSASLRCPRDRGLDYAVVRERHLKPVINLKDLIISEPSKSAPLSLLTQSKEALQIPFRPIEFIRKYPSIFQEFCPGSLNINPHVKLTPEVISLSSEERLLNQSVNYKQDIATRLLKLLMIGKVNKVPIFLLERLKWELGLPQDYETSVIPEFPDFFRVIDGGRLGGNWKMLELVCWSDEFSVSEMEKKRDKDGNIHFSLQYSKDFEMDKKYKKWVDEWLKLPYVSPYENAMHLAAKTDESDKWAVAVLHELLSLFVGNKADRENLLSLGEFFGLRSRFKRAFLQHPGIFYVSSKIGTHTVVLREVYRRGILIDKHPLVDMRFKYVQLMNVVKDEIKSKMEQQKTVVGKREGEEELEDEGIAEENDSEMDDESDDNDDDIEDEDEDEEGENISERGRFKEKTGKFEDKNPRRSLARRANGQRRKDSHDKDEHGSSIRFSRSKNDRGNQAIRGMALRKFEDKNPRSSLARRANGQRRKDSHDKDEHGSSIRFSRSKNDRGDQGIRGMALRKSDKGEHETSREHFTRQPANFDDRSSNSKRNNVARSINGRSRNVHDHDRSTRFSKQTNVHGDRIVSRRTPSKSSEDENATNREKFKPQPATFEGKNFRSSTARSQNGRLTNDRTYGSSKKFSRNIRSDQSLPRRTRAS